MTTLDGLVSFALPGREAARFISAGHPSDRFVLGLLRACADAVVVGAGTLRQEGAHAWSPEHAFPDAAAEFAALRAALRKPPHPLTVFVTASGEVDLRAPPFTSGDDVLVLTTRSGATKFGHPPARVRVRALDGVRPTARDIVNATAVETGAGLVVTEGGPSLFGQFVREGAVDDLFLTIAPQIAGRSKEEPRLGLVEATAFAPGSAPWWRLRSVKRSEDYLFLRFARRMMWAPPHEP